MKKEKYEKRLIQGKEVRIKIIKQLHGAWAGLDGKTIILNEKTKNSFNKEGIDSILHHERGHLSSFGQLLTFAQWILIIGAIIFLSLQFIDYSNLPIIYTLGLFILIIIISAIIQLPIAWAKEILCDWNAVNNSNSDIFRRTLQEFYSYNKKNSKPSFKRFYNGVILHPPQSIRLEIIRFMEKLRDKKS